MHHRSSTAPATDVSVPALLASLLLLAALVFWWAAPARAVDYTGDIAGELVSATADPASSGSKLLYSAPLRGRFVLTQACSDHMAVFVETGTRGQRLTYGNAGCTFFEPGIVMDRGERLYCVNRSGLSQSCSISGVYDETAGAPARPKVVERKS